MRNVYYSLHKGAVLLPTGYKDGCFDLGDISKTKARKIADSVIRKYAIRDEKVKWSKLFSDDKRDILLASIEKSNGEQTGKFLELVIDK